MAERKGRLKTENSTGRPGPGESAALFFICLVFYGAFAVIDGPRLFPDSQSYISMGITREPLYPLFLALLRKFADAVGWQAAPFSSAPAPYLFLAAFLQSLLAAYAAYLLGRRMAERMHERVSSRVMLYLAPAALFCVALLNRFAAGRGAAYHVSILTEGISFSLFVLFVLRCDRFFETAQRTGKSDAATRRRFVMQAFLLWLDLFLLLSLRKQLAVCAVTLCAAAFVIAAIGMLSKSERHRGNARMGCGGRITGVRIFLAAVCVSALALVSSTGLDLVYNRVLRGSFMQRTGNSEGMCCTLLYTAREADAELFEDPSERALFEKVYAEAYAKGSLYENLKEQEGEDGIFGTPGWEKTTTHFADHYDIIGYEVLHPVLQDDARGRGKAGSDAELAREVDRLEKILARHLMRQDLTRFFKLWGFNFAKGMINSILRMQRMLNAATVVLYGCFFALWLNLVRRGKARDLTRLAGIVLLGIVVNAAVAGAVIFPQPRYMIYGMALFYSMLAGMFLENFV